MASAYVSSPSILSVNGSTVSIGCETIYAGSDVVNLLQITHVVLINPSTDSPVTIRQKITDEVIRWAVTQNLTVAGPDILLPEFQKGV